MVSIMNQYIDKMVLQSDDITKAVLNNALSEQDNIDHWTIQVKSNRFIIDIHLIQFDVSNAVNLMNQFAKFCSYHYSSYYIRFNEGQSVRYRFATCKENKEGFCCDMIIR